MWEALFLVSFTINIICFLYIRWLLKYVANINQDIDNLSDTILQFSAHIKSVHDLEMFYGDETLNSLMNHSNELVEVLNNLDLLFEKNTDLEDSPKEEENV